MRYQYCIYALCVSALLAGDRAGDGSTSAIVPVPPPKRDVQSQAATVDWGELSRQSTYYLGIMHGFRLLTEPGTRDGLGGPFFHNYANSIGSLHGIADGDEFYVNYVGHPMMGSVAGFLFRQNDPKYRAVEFGRDRRYWKSYLRSTAFAWAFSEQFEIGPFSEASIGAVQARFPQQGFADHIITPAIGSAWMMGEDVVDRYLIRRIEGWTENRWARLVSRSALNPTRSLANVLRGQEPWYRDSRTGIYNYRPWMDAYKRLPPADAPPPDVDGVAPFEFSLPFQYVNANANTCLGGGGDAAFRLSRSWQAVLNVSGCKLLDPDKNLSGDALTYLIGPRWQPNPNGRVTPYFHVLVGGQKLSLERIDPELKQLLSRPDDTPEMRAEKHMRYTQWSETNGLALAMGGGVNVGLNRALALRVANVEYVQAWNNSVGPVDYGNGFRFSMGVTLRIGTW